MLNKKSMKILSIIVLAVMLMMTLGNGVMAVTAPSPADPGGTEPINNAVSKILGIMKYAGIIAAVVVAMYLGISYITKSPEGKAEIKKQLPLYIGGIAIILFATSIVNMITGALGGD